MDVLRNINAQGTTILMATHDFGIIQKYPRLVENIIFNQTRNIPHIKWWISTQDGQIDTIDINEELTDMQRKYFDVSWVMAPTNTP